MNSIIYKNPSQKTKNLQGYSRLMCFDRLSCLNFQFQSQKIQSKCYQYIEMQKISDIQPFYNLLFSFIAQINFTKTFLPEIIALNTIYMQQRADEYALKLIIIGDCGVGKTNILVRFCQNNFKQNYVATIGVDFKVKTITVKNKRLKLQIWDTAGQERFKNVTQAYYKGAAGIIMVYSITEARTFQNIERWIQQVNEHAPKDVIKILVANKLDMNSERIVQQREGQALANKFYIPFMEISAKTGENVSEMFRVLGELLLQEYLPKRPSEKIRYSLSSTVQLTVPKENRKCEC